MERNCKNDSRGLHIVIMDPKGDNDGNLIEFAKVFDTYKSSLDFEDFIK